LAILTEDSLSLFFLQNIQANKLKNEMTKFSYIVSNLLTV